MADTTNPDDFARTLGQMTSSALIRLAGAADALVRAQKAFDAGDVDAARLAVHNGTVGLDEHAVSINELLYDCLPRSGDGGGGEMG